ncbi:hypothetical protein Tco_0084511 [Tanacetum coccineum]
MRNEDRVDNLLKVVASSGGEGVRAGSKRVKWLVVGIEERKRSNSKLRVGSSELLGGEEARMGLRSKESVVPAGRVGTSDVGVKSKGRSYSRCRIIRSIGSGSGVVSQRDRSRIRGKVQRLVRPGTLEEGSKVSGFGQSQGGSNMRGVEYYREQEYRREKVGKYRSNVQEVKVREGRCNRGVGVSRRGSICDGVKGKRGIVWSKRVLELQASEMEEGKWLRETIRIKME